MVQATRSSKQSIAEGNMVSATSRGTEINLTSLASLEELQIDYEDFLCTNKLPLWDKNHRLAVRLRELNNSEPIPTYETFKKAIKRDSQRFVQTP